jgi:hypothetical protein
LRLLLQLLLLRLLLQLQLLLLLLQLQLLRLLLLQLLLGLLLLLLLGLVLLLLLLLGYGNRLQIGRQRYSTKSSIVHIILHCHQTGCAFGVTLL